MPWERGLGFGIAAVLGQEGGWAACHGSLGCREEGRGGVRGWRVEGGGWRVEGGGWRVEGGGWRVENYLALIPEAVAEGRGEVWEKGRKGFSGER